jgi:SAM-dependent methyltransferase
VVGIDVSAAMLDEARANIATGGLSNVQLHHQGDLAGLAAGSFDFVHSALVLQHIDIERGIRLFGDLVGLLGPRGVGALQFTYAKTAFAATFGVPPPTPMPASKRGLRAVGAAIASATLGRDPEMQMNAYPLNPLLFQLQAAQIARFHAEFTDHGGELGLFLFFQKP